MNSQIINTSDRILVTGAGGFVGAKVVEALLAKGFFNLRCFVRPSSRLGRLQEVLERANAKSQVELISGDLLSGDDCRRAAAGATVTYHLAAGIDKSFAGAFMNSAIATRNLIEALIEAGATKRFVNVSSFAVYSNLTLERGAVLDENSPLEDAPQERFDAYGFGKLKQEEIVRDYGAKKNFPYVILRPGSIFGPGNPSISGRVGVDTFGFFIHAGGENQLPLTYVDNCAEAIVLAGLTPGINGEIFNVVDDELPTSREFFQAYKKSTGAKFSLSVPYSVASALCRVWEKYARWSNGQLPPVFNRRRCAAEWKGNRFPNQKIRERLGWVPKIGLAQAMESYLAQHHAAAL